MSICKYCDTKLEFDDCGDVDFFTDGDIVTHDFYICPKCNKRYELKKLYTCDEELLEEIDEEID